MAYLPAASKSKAQSIFASIVVAQKYAVGSADRLAIDQAYRETQKLLAIAATSALVSMLIAMSFIKNVDLSQDPKGLKDETGGNSVSSNSNVVEVCHGPQKVEK